MSENKQPNQTQNHTEEEIDLGQLFILIGRAFSNFFSFLKSIIVTIFNLLIMVLLYTKKHFIKFIIALVLGGVTGYYLENHVLSPKFESSMTVRPNFGSTVQLYKNVEYYESLVDQKDYVKLAEILSLNLDEAKSLKHFHVAPYANENQALMAYKNFIKDLDTNSIKLIDYDQFRSDLPAEAYLNHVVTVLSTDKYVFNKLNDPIIVDVIRNKYYDKVKKTSLFNLQNKRDALQSSLIELDSLKNLYSKILLIESTKSNGGTNIYMGENNQGVKEVVVFDKYLTLNEVLIKVNQQLTEESDVVTVVSSFNPIGMKEKKWYINKTFAGALSFLILLIGVLLLKDLNNYLDNLNKIKAKVAKMGK